ncbi:F-box/FBD/LRR-repeat protein At1g78750-like [Vicia villosa]|uniref:F-box/FBD/LRR-repeat protein At1g78750-like n=1 Tax=Vicia villosa TaxID=3911 RepID=UPI00273AE39A|nr:F-box/FBD/LRR-repeat protein At1g78750-like [Vicia villosa]
MSSISDEDDRISSLPDDVICHILSFLQTKKVLTTSVFSKRWKNLWRSVPSFNFRKSKIWVDDREAQFRMNELAYSYLLSVNYIKSCYLDIYYNSDLGLLGLPNVINWIKAVVQRGVEDIKLYFELCMEQSESALSNADCFKFPMSILSCRTLVVIDLFGFAVKDFSSISLPSLKILSMDEIIFLNVQDFLLLLAGCPNLENLHTNCLEFLSQEFLTYQECQSLTLTNLTKADLQNTFCHFPLNALRNAEHLILEINEV